MIKIGGLCDRTGETKLIGIEYCPGVGDYIALVNRKGGVLGHKLEYTEVDTPTRWNARSMATSDSSATAS